jgi:type IV pilus assembly protein PilN
VIKINLKPTGLGEAGTTIDVVDSSANSEIQRKGLVHLLVMMILPAAMYVYGIQRRPERISQIANLTNQIGELTAFNDKQAAIVAEIKKISEDEKSVEERISAINKITVGRLVEIKVLDLLQTILREKMWLKAIEVKENNLTIEGMAQTDMDVSIFLEDLTKNILLRDVRLVETKQENFDGLNYARFKISAILEKSK